MCSKYKDADQLCSYCTAELHVSFCICQKWFSHVVAHIFKVGLKKHNKN